jgi:4,5-dihydroxyphthalate decarboxylase
MAPADLAGRRIGVRSWSRTTGVWARGILAHDYGVDPGSIDWVTFEPSHIAPLADPSRRADPGRSALAMLFDGELDAVIGEKPDDPRLRPVVPDPDAAARDWSLRHGFVPINHMLAVREALLSERPREVAALWSILGDAWRPPAPCALDATPLGIEANRAGLRTIIGYAAEQGIIPQGISPDDLFGAQVRRLVGE